MDSILQTGSDAGAVTREMSLGSPERTVHWSENSGANAVQPPRGERPPVEHTRSREKDATADHSVKKAEEGGPNRIGKEL